MKYSHIKPGDRVRVTLEGEVEGFWDGYDWLLSGDGAGVMRDCEAVVKVEKLKPPKPKAGDIITGQQVREAQWKRGSIIRTVIGDADDDISSLVLSGDGRWYHLNHLASGYGFGFADLHPAGNFRVLYVAE